MGRCLLFRSLPAGTAPQSLLPNTAIKIFTGAAVPHDANCIVRREDTVENTGGDQVTVQVTVPIESLRVGQNIRYRGENGKSGDEVLPRGTIITPTAMSAIATFAPVQQVVYKRVRVAVLNTGDELSGMGAAVEPWQIRDSNGPLLENWLRRSPWIDFVERRTVTDSLESVINAIESLLPRVDAILLTGGVSMGDADFVPAAIDALGGETVFHRLPIRPGRPVLGAALNGKLILGLPGNPVSVAVTSRVIGSPLLRTLAGIQPTAEPSTTCSLSNADEKSLPLTWFRLVQIASDSTVQLVGTQGSGDLVSLARSDGFVEVPNGASGAGPWRVRWW